ncbi:putative sensor-like histidine kinase YehU [Saccharicrinis fermentans DSM 9555 = JCM 21142]|uniref:Putative sensor-like histidine kinase YehU n=3 Tax=Saccharicrinis fermentans TaxID=982 RepID=W7XUC9_9BACT|nr:putative sensor-like histidine kinase YehU [Saccharicrinis fermentans DSM 9555 = JCM 21142]
MILLPMLFFRNKRLKYFISLTAILLLFVCTMYMRERYVRGGVPERGSVVEHPFMDGPPMDLGRNNMQRPERGMDKIEAMGPPREFIPPYVNLLVLTILLLGFDTGLKFSTKWLESEQTKIKLEKENVENKMAFLQNQISPHFFMNTLNNIHALVDISAEEAKDAIIKLSRMMGYMLYESKTDKVPLAKEMEFIRSYIELMKIRFTKEVNVELDIPDVLPAVHIPPLLTISYIENAFKHGISYSEPCFVRISFCFEKDRMTFDVINKIFERKAENKNSGVGIENSRNRLELIYGKDYKLDIGKLPDNKLFAVNLNVPI